MKAARSIQARGAEALTIIELIVLLSIAGFLAAMLLPALNKSGRAPELLCVRHLREIGLAARIFATDHHDTFPSRLSTNAGGCAEFGGKLDAPAWYFRCLSNQFTNTAVLVCDRDTRKAASNFVLLGNRNISYFVGWSGDETLPQSLLAGDRNLGTSSGWLDLYPTSRAQWDASQHGGQGCVVLGDGSVQQMSTGRLQQQLRESGLTNRLAIP